MTTEPVSDLSQPMWKSETTTTTQPTCSQGVDLVSAALVECQGKLKSAHMDATNPFFKSKYATLGAIIEASREPLYNAGLAVQQNVDLIGGLVSVHTIIRHKSGQCLDGGTMALPIGENDRNSDAQLAGSLMTYLKRYAWASVLGIYADSDDDGNNAPRGTVKPLERAASSGPRPDYREMPKTPPSATQTLTGATPKHLMKALNLLQGAAGQPNRAIIADFLRSKSWISGTQEPEAWNLVHVPATADQMAALVEDVAKFERSRREEVAS